MPFLKATPSGRYNTIFIYYMSTRNKCFLDTSSLKQFRFSTKIFSLRLSVHIPEGIQCYWLIEPIQMRNKKKCMVFIDFRNEMTILAGACMPSLLHKG